MNLSTDSLRALIVLTEKRDKLTAELAAVETRITEALGGASSAASTPKVRKGRGGGDLPPKAANKRGKRGAVRELILAGLKEAGQAGIAVRHLAVKLGIKPQNIHVWFHTTGKKSGLTEALGKGVYRLKSIGVESPISSLRAPKPKLRRAPRKSKKSNQA